MESKGGDAVAKSLDRIAKILSGMLLRDIENGDQKEKIRRLKQCGFGNKEIATMLNTSANVVGVAVHSLKKRRGRSKAKRGKLAK
jgi:DNA-binding NarL/FixJ family response regulator